MKWTRFDRGEYESGLYFIDNGYGVAGNWTVTNGRGKHATARTLAEAKAIAEGWNDIRTRAAAAIRAARAAGRINYAARCYGADVLAGRS